MGRSYLCGSSAGFCGSRPGVVWDGVFTGQVLCRDISVILWFLWRGSGGGFAALGVGEVARRGRSAASSSPGDGLGSDVPVLFQQVQGGVEVRDGGGPPGAGIAVSQVKRLLL